MSPLSTSAITQLLSASGKGRIQGAGSDLAATRWRAELPFIGAHLSSLPSASSDKGPPAATGLPRQKGEVLGTQRMGAGGLEGSCSSWEAGRELPALSAAVNSLLATTLFRLLGGEWVHSSPNKQRRSDLW